MRPTRQLLAATLVALVLTLPSGSATIITSGPDPAVGHQTPPKSAQRGPANTPKTDVFGTWVLTGVKVLGADVEFPQCATTLAAGTPPDTPDDDHVSPAPPPTLPAGPAWPKTGDA
jgi:hypothetical protein